MKRKISIPTFIYTVLAILALSIAQPVKAQQNAQLAEVLKSSTPEQRARIQTSFMKTKLDLDSLTAQKVYSINLKMAQKMEPVIKGDGSKFSRFRQARSIDGQKDEALKAVLNPKQYQAYLDAKEEMKEKLKEKIQEHNKKS